MASSREERLQMRQRGAGTRKIQEVDFGFSFGSPGAAASAAGDQSTAEITNSIDQVVQQSEPEQTQTETQTQTPPQARNETATTAQSPRSQPRSARAKQTPRLSAGHAAADQEQGRSSKRRKIDSRNDDSNDSPGTRNEPVATTNGVPTLNEGRQTESTDIAETTNAETEKSSSMTTNENANPPTPTEEPEASAKPKRGRRKSSAPKVAQPATEEAIEESPSTRDLQNNTPIKKTRGRRKTDNTQPVESNEPTRSRRDKQPADDPAENEEAQPEPKRKRRAPASQVTTTADTSPKETVSATRSKRKQQPPRAAEPEPVDADEDEPAQPKRKRRKSVKNNADKELELEQEQEEEEEEEVEPEPEPAQTRKRKGKQKASEVPAQEESAAPARRQHDQSQDQQDQPEPNQTAESAQPPKRRRGRPSAASEPSTRRSRPSSEDGGERRREGTVAIKVHRLADTSALEATAPDSDASSNEVSTDELDTRKTFPRRAGVNAADVLAQICQEIVDKHLAGLANSVANESNQTKRGEAGRQRKAVEAYGSQLQGRLFELSELLESNFALGVKLKKAKRETTEMRNRLLEVRRQRHEVALRMDAVRQKHGAEESAKMSRNAINNSLHKLESTLERSRTRPGESVDDDDDNHDNGIAGLEFTLRTVVEDVSSAAEGSHGGLLGQIRAFNAQLETTGRALGL
ncbi:uncharacterized protein TRUGW13939_00865 [Talaromyces rugulosus]|uniref:Inner kinetochore subunit AME1 domain-containing protein n=1 Tax=Talaromyces rugulosus TaxID=121627 RepID=A0A7H8QJZ5_TALRU|nr:uncharacterized protein TRUGW13939_00865 [Talaromyces rugulosus]QKX53785.1 hypothetical protein TRUGW13939_00865 [Talaromyces rugulosus]